MSIAGKFRSPKKYKSERFSNNNSVRMPVLGFQAELISSGINFKRNHNTGFHSLAFDPHFRVTQSEDFQFLLHLQALYREDFDGVGLI